MMHSPCTSCGRPAVEELECWRCDGKGVRSGALFGGLVEHKCDECFGSGKMPYCEKCAPKRKSEIMRRQQRLARRTP